MEKEDIKYFNKMAKYKPRNIETNSVDSAEYLKYFSTLIIDTANYALSEQISPKIAKKEIENLLENILKIEEGKEI